VSEVRVEHRMSSGTTRQLAPAVIIRLDRMIQEKRQSGRNDKSSVGAEHTGMAHRQSKKAEDKPPRYKKTECSLVLDFSIFLVWRLTAMLILAINGSPDKSGNTAFLLSRVLEEAKANGAKVDMVHVVDALEDQDKPYCDACSSPCNRSCIDGTNLEQVFNLLEKADGLVLGSPVYFGTVSAQMKAFWDKSRCVRTEKILIGKVGGAVSVGASRFGGQETTVRTLHDIMLIQGMNVIGDGSAGFDAGHQGVCGQKPADEDKEAIKRAKIMGTRIVEEAAKSR